MAGNSDLESHTEFIGLWVRRSSYLELLLSQAQKLCVLKLSTGILQICWFRFERANRICHILFVRSKWGLVCDLSLRASELSD